MKDFNHSQAGGGNMMIRILVVDDHPLVRESLKTIIHREPDLAVCGEAEDREQALELVGTVEPHLVVVVEFDFEGFPQVGTHQGSRQPLAEN